LLGVFSPLLCLQLSVFASLKSIVSHEFRATPQPSRIIAIAWVVGEHFKLFGSLEDFVG
jgi:hypothetical protein